MEERKVPKTNKKESKGRIRQMWQAVDPDLPDMFINAGAGLQWVRTDGSDVNDDWDAAAQVSVVIPPLNQLPWQRKTRQWGQTYEQTKMVRLEITYGTLVHLW